MDAEHPEPVRVHLASSDLEIGAQAAPRPRPDRIVTRFLTETVDDTNPVRPLLPDDSDRAGAWIQASGGAAAAQTGGKAAVAAGAGAAALPSTASLTRFDVTFTAATTAAGTITVSKVSNGNYTYDVPVGATGLSVSYPGTGLAPSGGGPTVTVAGVGAAITGDISVFGTLPATAGDVVLCASEADAQHNPPQGSVLPAAGTAPWPVAGQGAVWAAQKTPGTSCVISVTADYRGS